MKKEGWEKLCIPPVPACWCGREWPINLRLWAASWGGGSVDNVGSWGWSSQAAVGHGAGEAASLPPILLKTFPTRSSVCRFRYKFVQRSVITLPETWFDFLPSLSYLAQRRFKSYQIMKCYPLYSACICRRSGCQGWASGCLWLQVSVLKVLFTRLLAQKIEISSPTAGNSFT